MKFLIVDDDAIDREALSRRLRKLFPDCEIDSREDASGAALLIARTHYDCVLLDHRLPGDDGLSVLSTLRETELERAPAIVMLSGHGSERIAASALKLGADDYLPKEGLSAGELGDTIRAAMARRKDIHRKQLRDRVIISLATRDELTGVGNRSSLLRALDRCHARNQREQRGYGVIFVDLNGFKPINDEYGHDAGDAVLCSVAERLQKTVRESDSCFRYGGDEFAVLVDPADRVEDLVLLAERLVKVLDAPTELPQGQLAICGASLGIALCPEHATNPTELIARADDAMYAAKAATRGASTYRFARSRS